MAAGALAEFPVELTAPLLTFVAVTGLDVVHNAVHKAVWTLLTTNRPVDRVPVQFRLMNGDHEYPRPKAKRSSYEWYVPKGILKRNWMNKHLYVIPSLVVIFFDLDWNDASWNLKLNELCAKVQVARMALDGRNTKVAVVLIQQSSPYPPGEDVLAPERATALCTTCNLPGKLLFVLPHAHDHQFGYIIRLENAFYDLAQTYYQQQGKLVKSHREFLNKTTHQLLFVRHQFKMGFYNELRHDIPVALKHYKQAYLSLLEVRVTDTNIAEIKVIAGFISFKVCKLSFSRNVPLDAISQFRKHIDFFRNRVGHPDLLFEHSAWMSKQFCAFGDLFEDAIKAGLSAIQVQHPGFYYQQAAVHASTRKRLCGQLCQGVQYPNNDPLLDSDKLEYLGQRPWRPGIQSIELLDPQLEQVGITALQYKEATDVNHSMLIIPLLSSAISQFKRYRCPRMKRYLVVQMGEEYYSAQEYGKALTLLGHVMCDYQVEKWWSLLTSVVMTAVKCAYVIASVQEYVTLCLEITGRYIEVSSQEKERVQQNLIAALTLDQVPLPESGMTEHDARNAEQLWRSLAVSEPLAFTIDMSHVSGFLECFASFDSAAFPVDSPVSLSVSVRMLCPLPICFVKLRIIFSNETYDKFCVLKHPGSSDDDEGRTENLSFEPRVTRNFKFSFRAVASDVGQTVQISSVLLQLGNDYERCAVLRVKTSADDQRSSLSLQKSFCDTRVVNKDTKGFGHLATKIILRKSKLAIGVVHEAPALLNEVYELKLTFCNHESQDISDVNVVVALTEPHSSVSWCVDDLLKRTKPPDEVNRHCLNRISVGHEAESWVFFRGTREGSCTLLVKVEYVISLSVNGEDLLINCCSEDEVVVPVVQPFSVTSRILSSKMASLDVVCAEEVVLLHVDVASTSPFPVVLESSRFNLLLKTPDDVDASQVRDVVLSCGDVASECKCLAVPFCSNGRLSLGTYYISWKRCSTRNVLPVVETAVTLPTLSTVETPLSLSLDLPAHGWVRTPFTATYHIRNWLPRIQDFDFCMESSDSFMFAGHKQVHHKILPKSELTLSYNLYPLVSGFVCLPRLKLVTHDVAYDAQIEGLIQNMLPSNIFIMPQAKQWQERNRCN